jgi:hypothetical protein
MAKVENCIKGGSTNSEYRPWNNLMKLNDNDGGESDENDDILLIRQYP